ncbi:MAG TPA: class II aldolase/adducin family protein [Bacteroidales bacterium]|jgi:L-fuculose-phosphate aldolase|nr:class II aldolase/adducin family protein [Bacteroidales bacterium]
MEKEGPYKNERKEVARFMRRLYRQGLTTTSGGNISCRITEDTVIITPSATDKGRMRWKEVAIIKMNGENLTPGLKPSIELGMHLLIYRKNKHVSAIVHAHPLFATAFTAMKPKINTSLTAEARAVCGDPAFVPYAMMGTSELAELVSDCISGSDILLLENHGILAAGSSLLQAFDRLEVLENAAKMTMVVEMKGGATPLSPEKISEIDKLFR